MCQTKMQIDLNRVPVEILETIMRHMHVKHAKQFRLASKDCNKAFNVIYRCVLDEVLSRIEGQTVLNFRYGWYYLDGMRRRPTGYFMKFRSQLTWGTMKSRSRKLKVSPAGRPYFKSLPEYIFYKCKPTGRTYMKR